MIKRVLGLRFSSLIIGFIAVVSYVNVYALLESFKWVDHTHDVIYQVHTIKDDVATCPTAIREFVFTGNKQFIEPYYNKSPGIIKGIDELQWLTRDNEKQQKNCYELRLNIERRLALFRSVLEIYKNKGQKEAEEQLIEGFGEPTSIAVKTISDTIENEERRLLDLRMHDYTLRSNTVLYGIPILIVIYLIIFNLSLNSIQTHILKGDSKLL